MPSADVDIITSYPAECGPPGVVAASTNPRTRDGYRKANSCAIMPPMDTPTMCAESMPR